MSRNTYTQQQQPKKRKHKKHDSDEEGEVIEGLKKIPPPPPPLPPNPPPLPQKEAIPFIPPRKEESNTVYRSSSPKLNFTRNYMAKPTLTTSSSWGVTNVSVPPPPPPPPPPPETLKWVSNTANGWSKPKSSWGTGNGWTTNRTTTWNTKNDEVKPVTWNNTKKKNLDWVGPNTVQERESTSRTWNDRRTSWESSHTRRKSNSWDTTTKDKRLKDEHKPFRNEWNKKLKFTPPDTKWNKSSWRPTGHEVTSSHTETNQNQMETSNSHNSTNEQPKLCKNDSTIPEPIKPTLPPFQVKEQKPEKQNEDLPTTPKKKPKALTISILQSPTLIKKAERITNLLSKEIPSFDASKNILPSKPIILKGISQLEKKIVAMNATIKSIQKEIEVKEQEEKKYQEELNQQKEAVERELEVLCKQINEKSIENDIILQDLYTELENHKQECLKKEELVSNNTSCDTHDTIIDKPGEIYKLIQAIHSNNSTIANQSHDKTVNLTSCNQQIKNVKGVYNALYNDPMDAPDYHHHNKIHELLHNHVREYIKWNKKLNYDKLCELGYEYNLRHEQFAKNCPKNDVALEQVTSTSIMTSTSSIRRKPNSTISTANTYNRRSRMSNTARSEYEQEQIIAQLTAKEKMSNGDLSVAAVLPRQLSLYPHNSCKYHNNFSCKKYDPIAELQESKYTVWSDVEKCIFLDRFFQSPKNFKNISLFLRNKSVRDCIQFYYDSKKTIPYKKALQEYLARSKKRRTMHYNPNNNIIFGLDATKEYSLWEATIQAALSVGAIVEKGDSVERPIKFRLPSDGKDDLTFHTRLFHPLNQCLFDTVYDHLNDNETSRSSQDVVVVEEKPTLPNGLFSLDENQMTFLRTVSNESITNSPNTTTPLAEEKNETSAAISPTTPRKSPQKWNSMEKKQFLEIVSKHGKSWNILSNAIPTKTISQIKNYYYDHKKQFGKSNCVTNVEKPKSGGNLLKKKKRKLDNVEANIDNKQRKVINTPRNNKPLTLEDTPPLPPKHEQILPQLSPSSQLLFNQLNSISQHQTTTTPLLPPLPINALTNTTATSSLTSLAQLVNAAAAVDAFNDQSHQGNDINDASLVLSYLLKKNEHNS